MDVYIGRRDDYSAMRGPYPEGFHIPSKDEWVALCGILTSTFGMASNATTMGTYLKMPMAGFRFNGTTIGDVGAYGYYWSATPSSSNSYRLLFDSSSLSPQSGYRRVDGFSLRGFKDKSVAPDSSWTTLYDGSSVVAGAGVFYNSTLGLISVSGDGRTWYTIQDKNLGATTVYNQGNTLTDANCGKFYQRGNNYGFSHSGTVTSSTTQVDASNYGPGNYYSSSTFISVDGDWSSVRNDDLRGGATGIQVVGHPIKNAYVGEYAPINTPGIYYDATLGLISLSSDGSSWLTITDKNLGATTVYNDGDTLSEANCGKLYQWGNNYGFPLTGSITTSSTRVSTSGYGPNNYYSSSTFITGSSNRSSTSNNNLWGDTTNTLEARKGPCNTGYHIPSISEFEGLINMLDTIGIDISNGEQLKLYLKMPYSGRRDTSGTYGGSNGILWSSSPQSQDAMAMRLSFSSTSLSTTARSNKTFGIAIRPFKNEAVQPYTSRTKLY